MGTSMMASMKGRRNETNSSVWQEAGSSVCSVHSLMGNVDTSATLGSPSSHDGHTILGFSP